MNRTANSRKSAASAGRPIALFGVAVKAVIVHKHSVLLLRRALNDRWKPGQWDLPGGRLHANEQATDGLRREVLEETGARIEDPTPIRIWNFVDHDVPVIGVTFFAVCRDSTVRLSREHGDHQWVGFDEIDGVSLPKAIRADILATQDQRRLREGVFAL